MTIINSAAWLTSKWGCTYIFSIHGQLRGRTTEIYTGCEGHHEWIHLALAKLSLNSDSPMQALIMGMAAFGAMKWILSNRGSHFTPSLRKDL